MNKTACKQLRNLIIKVMLPVSFALLAPTAHAQTFMGSNSSSEKIIISINANGTADLAWYPVRSTNIATREVWLVSSEVNGFRLIASPTSQLKKSGDVITYSRISNKSSTMHCTSGCASTMPNLIGLSR